MNSDSFKNVVAVLSLFVSCAAFGLTGLVFRYQYVDHISAIANVTQVVLGLRNDNGKLEGAATINIFNTGNRPIIVSVYEIYVVGGDYKYLKDNDKYNCDTGPNHPSLPLTMLTDPTQAETTLKALEESKIVPSQQIGSFPVSFNGRLPQATSNDIVQGSLCLKVTALDYAGSDKTIFIPMGTVSIPQRPSPNIGPFGYTPMRKQGERFKLF